MAASLDGLLTRLRDADPGARQDAAEQLEQRFGGLGWREGLQVLDATRAAPLPLAGRWADTRVFLVHLLGRNPSQRYLGPIAELYPEWDDPTRAAGLAVIAKEASADAARRFVDLLGRFGWPKAPRVAFTHGFLAKARHGDVLFPAVLRVPAAADSIAPLLELTEVYARRGAIDLGAMPEAGVLVEYAARARAQLPQLAPGQALAERFTRDYALPRFQYRWLLSLCANIGGDAAVAELRAACASVDPRLAVAGIEGLLANHQEVPAADVARCAADEETRALLWRALRRAERSELFPAAEAAEPDLARSEMTLWLTDPEALGRAPVAIEVVKPIEVPQRRLEQKARFYLLRFRAEAGGPWLAGIAGPYGNEAPQLSGAMTGSLLEEFEDRSDEEHFVRIVNALHRVARERTGAA